MGFCAPDKDQSGRRAGRSQCRSAGTPDKAKASGIGCTSPHMHAFDDSYADKMLVESMHRASRLTLTYILSVSSSVTGALVGMQIPVVDLSRGDADAALTVRSACEKFGFFHGAPSCSLP